MLATALATMAWSAPAEKPTPDQQPQTTVAKPADLPSEAVDLTDKVEVTVQGALKSTSRTAHSATILVKNTSKEDLHGPIIVVVDQTGIEALKLDEPSGTLSDDRPYVEIVNDKGELKAGKSLKPQKLLFSTEESISTQSRREFDLKVRVCQLDKALAEANKQSGSEKIEGKSYSWKDFDKAAAIQEKWTLPLIQQGKKEVYGTAISEDENGNLRVTVYTQRTGTARLLPETIEGLPVHVEVIGQMFNAGPAKDDRLYSNGIPRHAQRGNENDFKAVPDAGTATPQGAKPQPLPPVVDPTVRFNRPVPIGVSISNPDVLGLYVQSDDTIFCYSGTLGCRCVDSVGTQYVLSNLHVMGGIYLNEDGEPSLASPIILFASTGDDIVQPATGDSTCSLITADVIAHVSDFEPIRLWADEADAETWPMLMDACVAAAVPGAVGFNPPANGYPALRRDVLDRPTLGTPVQKYGRTSSYTDGTITELNAFALVNYSEVPDGTAFGFFIRQLTISNVSARRFPTPAPPYAEELNPSNFGNPGDSGSLIVARKPGATFDGQPVALLFAGGPNGLVARTIANPIGPILKRFGLQIDDGQGAGNQAGTSGSMGGAIAPTNPIFGFAPSQNGQRGRIRGGNGGTLRKQ
ncbi:MAG: hypothetical protein U0992_22960 [Planctomycetaceae bacterium]